MSVIAKDMISDVLMKGELLFVIVIVGLYGWLSAVIIINLILLPLSCRFTFCLLFPKFSKINASPLACRQAC